MSEAGSPMGFLPPNRDRQGMGTGMPEGLRLLYIILGIVLVGAGVFVGITLGLP
jgi:hypothetical protein